MTYNDIATPIRKTNYGEADIIYSFLTAHHGRVDAIAKGIRKSTSRKRGNIDFGIFSSLQFAKGTNLDIVVEAQMLEYNQELLTSKGLNLIFNSLPIVNKLATDIEHSSKIFDILKECFITFEEKKYLYYEILLKYKLLEVQDILPDLNKCSMCKVYYDKLNKYSTKSHYLICNNCARKIESSEINLPLNDLEIENMNLEDQKVFLDILNNQIHHSI